MQQEINQLQTAINGGWLPDDIREAMHGNEHIAQVTVEAAEPGHQDVENGVDDNGDKQYKQVEIERLAIVYQVPNGDDTTTTHRAVYDANEVKRLLKAANNG